MQELQLGRRGAGAGGSPGRRGGWRCGDHSCRWRGTYSSTLPSKPALTAAFIVSNRSATSHAAAAAAPHSAQTKAGTPWNVNLRPEECGSSRDAVRSGTSSLPHLTHGNGCRSLNGSRRESRPRLMPPTGSDRWTDIQPAPGRTRATQLASSRRPPRTREATGHEEERRDHAPDNSLQRPPKHEARDEGEDAEHHGEEDDEGRHQPSMSERRAAASAASYRNRAR